MKHGLNTDQAEGQFAGLVARQTGITGEPPVLRQRVENEWPRQ